MKSVMRTIERVVTRNKRKRDVALGPKGTKPDYSNGGDIIGNGQTVSVLQMAPKAFIIICGVELGKRYAVKVSRTVLRLWGASNRFPLGLRTLRLNSRLAHVVFRGKQCQYSEVA